MTSREYSGDQMAAWLAENGYRGNKVVKVLVLGNSGAGKSFLCNVIIGEELFENKTQIGSVTAVNTFIPACVGDVAYVVCNIPGLIEADQANIPRNKAAIEAAFKFQEGCPTICLFVASATGGRVKHEDYQAIHAVKKYVNLHPSATAFIVNAVDFDELDDPQAYRADAEGQVHSLVDKDMAVVLTPKMPRKRGQTARFDTPEMSELQGVLVHTLKNLTPVTMQPEAGAELVLEHERLKKEFAELNERMRSLEAHHKAMVEQNDAAWRAAIARSEAEHQRQLGETRRLIEELKNRPPQIVLRGNRRRSGGCCIQ